MIKTLVLLVYNAIEIKEPTDEFNSTYGIHSRKISTYTHINEKDFNNKDEQQFILDTIRNS
jgi:hypothetical protein